MVEIYFLNAVFFFVNLELFLRKEKSIKQKKKFNTSLCVTEELNCNIPYRKNKPKMPQTKVPATKLCVAQTRTKQINMNVYLWSKSNSSTESAKDINNAFFDLWNE